MIDCPVAHGEGNFQVNNTDKLHEITASDQIALAYVHPDGSAAAGQYPVNPNGSVLDIAGICNLQGNVLGLMPHPEDHVYSFQTADRQHRAEYSGLPLFLNGVSYAADL